MMTGFVDIEAAFCELLGDIAAIDTATPENLTGPFICVERVPGGGTDRLGLQDTAFVEVQCFDMTRAESVALNAQVRARLAGARQVGTSFGLIDKIVENSPPTQLPYADVELRWTPSTWVATSRIQ
jgi:hypothetical protein